MITIFITILIIGAISFFMFSTIGWCVGIFNKSLNSNQRIKAGFYVTVYVFLMICLNGWQWSKESDRLDKIRGDAFKNNNPGYYDINSANFGNERLENYELKKAKEAIVLYDDKMVHKILLWIGLYILLFIIGFIGENIYPLVD